MSVVLGDTVNFKSVGKIPKPRYSCGLCSDDNPKIYIYGGRCGAKTSKIVLMIFIVYQVWTDQYYIYIHIYFIHHASI